MITLSCCSEIVFATKVCPGHSYSNELCSITGREMAETRKLIRPNPRIPIVRNDVDRCTLLNKSVEIIEKHDTVMEGHMKRWVSAVKA